MEISRFKLAQDLMEEIKKRFPNMIKASTPSLEDIILKMTIDFSNEIVNEIDKNQE
jgi:hypothetical protein